MVRVLRLFLFPTALTIFSSLGLLPAACGQSRIDCNAIASRILKQTVHYCVLLPSGYDTDGSKQPAPRYPVLYFLHGLGENEQTLFNTGGWNLIEDLRQQHKISDLLIVAPEARRSFYINSADGHVLYSDFFLREFMPAIEHKYRIRPGREGRAITGVSMGGYGALRLAFAHPELFSSVSAQSAALMIDSPQQLDQAMRSGSPLGSVLGAVFGDPIDVPHWRENNPFVLAKEHPAELRRLAIYFNCGQADDYGFEKGARALDRQLQAERIPHEFHLYRGDHSLAYFMAHMGETLEFHSRVFAGGR